MGRTLSKIASSKRNKAEKSIMEGIKILKEIQSRADYSDGYLALGELFVDTKEKEKDSRE